MSSSTIHASAVIEQGAVLEAGVTVGPFCHVGPKVVLKAGVKLLGQVSVQGDTTVGANTRIFPFASVGSEPQDLKYKNEPVRLEIGSNCTIREGVTMNPGTAGGQSLTRVGDNCVFLANSHVAHDCMVGNGVILSNNVMLAGHCVVGDHVIFGGGSGAHQFCRIGNNAFIGGLAGIEGDVIPFGMAIGNRASLAGLNLIGMKRAKFPRESIHLIRGAYKRLFDGSAPVQEIAKEMRAGAEDEKLVAMLDFVLAAADRALCTPAQS